MAKKRQAKKKRYLNASLGLRLEYDLKEKIEIAGQRSGRGMSQEALYRLRKSFVDVKETAPADARAIGALVERLADEIEQEAAVSWRKDAFVSAALGAGFRLFLARLGASGEMQVPEKLKQAWAAAETSAGIEDPRLLGERIAVRMLEALRYARHADVPDLVLIYPRDQRGHVDLKGDPVAIDPAPEHQFWVQLANDLGLTEEKS